MITLTARIELLSTDNAGVISRAQSSAGKNNISADIQNVVGTKKVGRRPFIIGGSKIGDGCIFSTGEDYYMGNIVSRETNGEYKFSTPYTITIYGKDISTINIIFDTQNKQFPTSIEVDGQTYSDDDPAFLVFVEKADTHTIVIDNWNAPNFPLRIQGLFVDVAITLDKSNLMDISRTISDRSDFTLPSWGIISNTGDIQFVDLDSEIADYAQMQLLKSGLKVIISVNNTLTHESEHVGTFLTKDWNYDNYNRVVQVSLEDDLLAWQDITIEGYKYTGQEATAKDIYLYLQSRTPSKYEFEPLNDTTNDKLLSTKLQYPYFSSCSLWEGYQKLCELVGLHIYKNNNNKVVCIYNV